LTVLIENLQRKIAVTDHINGLLNRSVELSLRMEEFHIPCEISIMLVDNEEIQDINREHRHIDKPTDVLSFPMADIAEGKLLSDTGDYDMDENLLLLGDIIVSMEKAREQAEEYGHSLERELAFLTTHGIFHLLGYDHQQEEEEIRMLAKQEAVLEQMGLKRAIQNEE
jgi:probable rRNA maturation factor